MLCRSTRVCLGMIGGKLVNKRVLSLEGLTSQLGRYLRQLKLSVADNCMRVIHTCVHVGKAGIVRQDFPHIVDRVPAGEAAFDCIPPVLQGERKRSVCKSCHDYIEGHLACFTHTLLSTK